MKYYSYSILFILFLGKLSIGATIDQKLVIDISDSLELKTSIIIQNKSNIDKGTPLYIIVPFKNFRIRDIDKGILVLHDIDELRQRFIHVFIPANTSQPLEIDGSIDIPKLEPDQENSLHFSEKDTFIYRKNLGVDNQIFIRFDSYKDSQKTKMIAKEYMADFSEVILKFPNGTKFINNPSYEKVSFRSDDIRNIYEYIVRKSKSDSPPFFTVTYRLPTNTQIPGMLIISIIGSILASASIGLDLIGNTRPAISRTVYLLLLLLYIAGMIYFFVWNQRYLYENIEEFVSPSVAAVILLLFLIKSFI